MTIPLDVLLQPWRQLWRASRDLLADLEGLSDVLPRGSRLANLSGQFIKKDSIKR